MKVLLFGKSGQVAWELQRSLPILGSVKAVDSSDVNFLSLETVVKAIREYRPTHIINAAAYTHVDKAESEKELATQINGSAVGVIAEEAKKIGSLLVHYSTDYVFDGFKESPYVEMDKPAPINTYGKSKLLGEQNIIQVGGDFLILRVSWIYGDRGTNFYRTMLRLAREREEIKIVGDQIGTPTWCRHIADATSHILRDEHVRSKSGTYHMAPLGETTWYHFAEKIFETYRKSSVYQEFKVKDLLKISSSEYFAPAKRPLNSRMDSSKLEKVFNIRLPHWEESLEMVMRGCK